MAMICRIEISNASSIFKNNRKKTINANGYGENFVERQAVCVAFCLFFFSDCKSRWQSVASMSIFWEFPSQLCDLWRFAFDNHSQMG